MSPPSVASPIITASLKEIGEMPPLVLMYFMIAANLFLVVLWGLAPDAATLAVVSLAGIRLNVKLFALSVRGLANTTGRG